jgi:hypothetical protein
MSGFWAQNTRKVPQGSDDKSASLPKSQWLFSEGVNLGKHGIIWFLISYSTSNTRKLPGSDDKSATSLKSQWLFF